MITKCTQMAIVFSEVRPDQAGLVTFEFTKARSDMVFATINAVYSYSYLSLNEVDSCLFMRRVCSKQWY